MDVSANLTNATPQKALDLELALSRVGGDRELLQELIELFLQESPKMLSELQDATAAGDAQTVENTAHGLKGSAANFGAEATVDAAFRLEMLGREKKNAEFSEALLALEENLLRLSQELANIEEEPAQ